MDIRNFLTKKGIYFVEGGKGIGQGNISISCPNCKHPKNFSINLEGRGYHCWSCGFKGKSYPYLLGRLGIQNVTEFKQVNEDELKKKENIITPLPDFVFSLNEILDLEVTKLVLEFLQLKKGFDLQSLKQHCSEPAFEMYVSFDVDLILGNRIFLPLYLTTEKSIGFYSRYYLPTNSLIKHYTKGNCLYNFPFLVNSTKKLLVVHESCLDAYKWNILSTISVASASLTNRFSLFQLEQLKSISNSFEKIIILLDNDSESKTITLRTLTNLTKLEIPNLIIINIRDFCNKKDFGDLSNEDSTNVVQEIEKMAFNFRKATEPAKVKQVKNNETGIIQKASNVFKIPFIDNNYLKFCIKITQKVIDKKDLENDLNFFILLCECIEKFVSNYKINSTFNDYLEKFFTESFPNHFDLIDTKWTNDDPLIHEFVKGMYNICGLEEPVIESEEPVIESEEPVIESEEPVIESEEQLELFKFNFKHTESSLVTIIKEHCSNVVNDSVDIDLKTLEQLLIISMEYYNDNVCEIPPSDLTALLDFYKILVENKAERVTLIFGNDDDLSVRSAISVNQESSEKIEKESIVDESSLENLLKSLISEIKNTRNLSNGERDLIGELITVLFKRII